MTQAAPALAVRAALGAVKVLARVSEPSMRALALAEALAQMDDELAAHWLDTVVRGAVAKHAACTAVYAGMLEPGPLVERLSPERLLRLRDTANSLGLVAATHWLAAAEPQPSPRKGAISERLVHQDLRRMTLGARRALARRAKGEMLKKLLQDPDPQVVTNLLANPRSTESVALAVASHRPTLSAPLEAVLTVRRFAQRYRVRLALTKNPHLDDAVAARLLVCLDGVDLATIREDGSLSGSRRLAAQRLLELEG
jgi:hypothetical protein